MGKKKGGGACGKATKGAAGEEAGVTPDSCLDNKSDIFHHNNENNQLKRQVRPPRDVH